MTPNRNPAVKAAMKMLPPSPVAIPAASSCRRHRQDLQPVRLHGQATRDPERERAQDAGRHASDEAVADLLQHEVHGGVRRHSPLVPFGEGKRDEEERDADSVVQAALDVETLPDPRRDPLVGDDRLAERRVGAGEHDREHERLDQADAGQHADPDERAGGDRERQTDPEQPGRYRELRAQRRERDPGGVSEEDERQRRLRQQLDGLAADTQIDQAEYRPCQQARGGEEDRRRDERPLEPAGDGREREQHQRNRREFPGSQRFTFPSSQPERAHRLAHQRGLCRCRGSPRSHRSRGGGGRSSRRRRRGRSSRCRRSRSKRVRSRRARC